VNEETKLEQIIKQVRKQSDVLEVTRYDDGHQVFDGLQKMI